jgi:hypothetical protein
MDFARLTPSSLRSPIGCSGKHLMAGPFFLSLFFFLSEYLADTNMYIYGSPALRQMAFPFFLTLYKRDILMTDTSSAHLIDRPLD